MIPSVVYGYFALIYLTPFFAKFFPEIQPFNVLSASVAMGIMILPLMTSLTYDALKQTPMELRYGAYALGATKLYTAINILLPSIFKSYFAIIMLCITRAVGETMIVTIAAGQMPQLTISPLQAIQTMCSYIASTATGEIAHGTIEYMTVNAVGLLLIINVMILMTIQMLIKEKHK